MTEVELNREAFPVSGRRLNFPLGRLFQNISETEETNILGES
jgi:hypothetical protein